MNDKVEARQETAAKVKGGWKVIAGVVVVAIILLQAFWSMMESTITKTVTETMAKETESLKVEQSEIRSGLTGLEGRVAEAEAAGSSLDIEAVKADAASIMKAGEDFEKKLSALIQAEEMKLAAIEKDAADQKAYVDGLKSLLRGLGE